MKSHLIEKDVLFRNSDWEFDESVSMIFDSHVRKSIPCYDDVHYLIAEISKNILNDNALVYDLGTATGEVIVNVNQANQAKNIRYIGIDQSLHMLIKAKLKCEAIDNVIFYNEKIEQFEYEIADLIIAAFTLQFTPVANRIKILQKIKGALKANGFFILCEKVKFENKNRDQLFTKIYENWKRKYFTTDEIIAKKESLKNVMQPLTLTKNIELLQMAGFKEINIFFKWCNFACILAK